jgi:hypothetical protein
MALSAALMAEAIVAAMAALSPEAKGDQSAAMTALCTGIISHITSSAVPLVDGKTGTIS